MKPLSRAIYYNTGIKYETLLTSIIPQYRNQIWNPSHEHYTTIHESNMKPLSRALYHNTRIKHETPLTSIIPLIQESNMKPLSRAIYYNTGTKYETPLTSIIPQYRNQIWNPSHEHNTTIQESNMKPLPRKKIYNQKQSLRIHKCHSVAQSETHTNLQWKPKVSAALKRGPGPPPRNQGHGTFHYRCSQITEKDVLQASTNMIELYNSPERQNAFIIIMHFQLCHVMIFRILVCLYWRR